MLIDVTGLISLFSNNSKNSMAFDFFDGDSEICYLYLFANDGDVSQTVKNCTRYGVVVTVFWYGDR